MDNDIHIYIDGIIAWLKDYLNHYNDPVESKNAIIGIIYNMKCLYMNCYVVEYQQKTMSHQPSMSSVAASFYNGVYFFGLWMEQRTSAMRDPATAKDRLALAIHWFICLAALHQKESP